MSRFVIAVKGGTGIALREGVDGTRFTRDLDVVATARDVESFLDDVAERLGQGWGGFTGRVVRQRQATPDGVPNQYVVTPAKV